MYNTYMEMENNSQIQVLKKENKLYLAIKRFIDIILSLVALVVLSPVFIFIAVVVKIDSKGSVFFGHERLGKNGEIIKVYKFRTMVENAELLLDKMPEEVLEQFKENFKLDDDPRITKVGKFLRESSLDELPQFFNIFIGNMSIVGPRPIIIKEKEKYGRYIDKLLSIKPGLTGNWQVNGRSDTTYEERVQMDMEYIDSRNLWLDIKIFLKTFIAVFQKRGAK